MQAKSGIAVAISKLGVKKYEKRQRKVLVHPDGNEEAGTPTHQS